MCILRLHEEPEAINAWWTFTTYTYIAATVQLPPIRRPNEMSKFMKHAELKVVTIGDGKTTEVGTYIHHWIFIPTSFTGCQDNLDTHSTLYLGGKD